MATSVGEVAPLLASSARVLRIEQHIGLGYARSTEAELQFVCDVARATGVCLDPVYSGKGALGMVEDLQRQATGRAQGEAGGAQQGGRRRVLFIHTGGLLGLYEKEAQLAPLLPAVDVAR